MEVLDDKNVSFQHYVTMKEPSTLRDNAEFEINLPNIIHIKNNIIKMLIIVSGLAILTVFLHCILFSNIIKIK